MVFFTFLTTLKQNLTMISTAVFVVQFVNPQYFSITSGESSTDISFHKTPVRTWTDFNATTYGNSYTNTAQTYGTARTRTTGGQVYSVSNSCQSNTIIMFHEKPDNIEPYDARFIYQSIIGWWAHWVYTLFFKTDHFYPTTDIGSQGPEA